MPIDRDMYQKYKHLHTSILQSTQFQALEDRVLLWVGTYCSAKTPMVGYSINVERKLAWDHTLLGYCP